MRKKRIDGNFFICLLINMLINLEGLIPGVILIVLHFFFDISIWWGIGAIGIWILYLIVWLCIFKWANTVSNTPDKPKENKNPYSSGPYVASVKHENTADK